VKIEQVVTFLDNGNKETLLATKDDVRHLGDRLTQKNILHNKEAIKSIAKAVAPEPKQQAPKITQTKKPKQQTPKPKQAREDNSYSRLQVIKNLLPKIDLKNMAINAFENSPIGKPYSMIKNTYNTIKDTKNKVSSVKNGTQDFIASSRDFIAGNDKASRKLEDKRAKDKSKKEKEYNKNITDKLEAINKNIKNSSASRLGGDAGGVWITNLAGGGWLKKAGWVLKRLVLMPAMLLGGAIAVKLVIDKLRDSWDDWVLDIKSFNPLDWFRDKTDKEKQADKKQRKSDIEFNNTITSNRQADREQIKSDLNNGYITKEQANKGLQALDQQDKFISDKGLDYIDNMDFMGFNADKFKNVNKLIKNNSAKELQAILDNKNYKGLDTKQRTAIEQAVREKQERKIQQVVPDKITKTIQTKNKPPQKKEKELNTKTNTNIENNKDISRIADTLATQLANTFNAKLQTPIQTKKGTKSDSRQQVVVHKQVIIQHKPIHKSLGA